MSESATLRLAAALLAGSPHVMQAGLGLCRVDAGGWGRRGGEQALCESLVVEAARAGFPSVYVGVADVAIAADAAAWLAEHETGRCPGSHRIERGVLVESGAESRFLAPLPLRILPMDEELRETFRTLGLRLVRDLAERRRSEIEARFGRSGVCVHRWACGEDDRRFSPLRPESLPEATWELEGTVPTLEPLLFVLRHLVNRICADLAWTGKCAEHLCLRLRMTDGERREERVVPARPTRRESLLYDLCRAALERTTSGEARLPAPAEALTLRVERWCRPGARQADLFAGDWRDPLAAEAAISRLRARFGEEVVVWPSPRRHHRPETRSGWIPVQVRRESSGVSGLCPQPPASLPPPPGSFPSTLRLLARPVAVQLRTAHDAVQAVQLRTAHDRPLAIRRDTGRWDELLVAEGPERYSGDWWVDGFQREYYRVCTAGGEVLWVFREARRAGWWLHGWWD